MDKLEALEILDELDALRRNHYFDKPQNNDWVLRVAAAIVAKKAGFQSRIEWVEELKNNSDSKYCVDYLNYDYAGTW